MRYSCITEHLKTDSRCPSCYEFASVDDIVSCQALVKPDEETVVLKAGSFAKLIDNANGLSTSDIDLLISTLQKKKQSLETAESSTHMRLLKVFLERSKSDKQKMKVLKGIQEIEKLQRIVQCIDGDMTIVESNLSQIDSDKALVKSENAATVPGQPVTRTSRKRTHAEMDVEPAADGQSGGFQDQAKRMLAHLDDLQSTYIKTRVEDLKNNLVSLPNFSESLARMSQYSHYKVLAHIFYADRITLGTASSIISAMDFDKDDERFAAAGVTRKISVYDYATVVKNLNEEEGGGRHRKRRPGFVSAARMGSGSGRNGMEREELPVSEPPLDSVPRYPILEMKTSTKVSALSFNAYLKHQVASSDADGIVNLWDISTGVSLRTYEEHEKRCWSVDFCKNDPMLIASGGDDAKVKVWSTTQKGSVATIDARANVCSVKWNPGRDYEIAFGSADHMAYYFDLRNIARPLHVLSGHAKAVAYVTYLSRNEIITASTDSTLRLWDISESESNSSPANRSPSDISTRLDFRGLATLGAVQPRAAVRTRNMIHPLTAPCGLHKRTYLSHKNEKNFVGLSINSTGEFIACGSENNSVYTYYSRLSSPVIVLPFGKPIEPISGGPTNEDNAAIFVTSVCYKRHSPDIMLAANSEGRIKVLQLV
ncbi:coatomer subunit alpha [Irineochytrium annulatum]|nr:coatomer subunit alpha [Irineochytrium annulatum]